MINELTLEEPASVEHRGRRDEKHVMDELQREVRSLGCEVILFMAIDKVRARLMEDKPETAVPMCGGAAARRLVTLLPKRFRPPDLGPTAAA